MQVIMYFTDLYDWACKDNDYRGAVVNRTMVKVKNQSSPRLSRSPSRKSSLRSDFKNFDIGFTN